METVERNWDLITESLTTAVRLISSFGFSGMNFGNQNAVMIIAYYLSRRPDRNRFLEAPACSEDRGAIRRWLMTVLIKRGLWASTDALLGRARTPYGKLQPRVRQRCRRIRDGPHHRRHARLRRGDRGSRRHILWGLVGIFAVVASVSPYRYCKQCFSHRPCRSARTGDAGEDGLRRFGR